MSDAAPPQDDKNVLDKALEAASTRHTGGKEPSLMTVLLGAVFADGEAHEAELAEFDMLVKRINTFKALGEEQRIKLRQDTLSLVNGTDTARNDHVRTACVSLLALQRGDPKRNLPPMEGLAEAAFAHACDLVFADMKVTEEERQFLRMLSEALEIPTDRAKFITQQLGLKNDY